MADEAPQDISNKWTEDDTRRLITWHAANSALFTGQHDAATKGYEAFISQYGLEGVTPSWAKKKWENLKQKYKDAAVCSPPSVVTPERSEEQITPKRRRVEANNDALIELL